MLARKIICDGGFSPDDVTYLTDVLEAVWQEIIDAGHQTGADQTAARERLALIVMASAKSGIMGSPEAFRAHVKRAFSGTLGDGQNG